MTDPLLRVTTYGYDSLSRPHTVSNPAIQVTPLVTRTYSPNGHLASLTVARGNAVADTTDFAYDGLDRLSTTTWADSSTETRKVISPWLLRVAARVRGRKSPGG